ncbi:unnamed protein product [marine sediment metagenome]|uniref:Uncharacterized protein n=1 Tax=marine sediment metagenome TaxID=412755 RepID=X1SCB2_9ZZZZ
MKALLIEVDFSTGRRAGGIQIKNNPNLWCDGWQDLEAGLEIRIVKDGNTKPYEGVKGITILDGEKAINAAIDANIPTQYAVRDMNLLIAHMKEKGISLDTVANKSAKQIAQEAFALNLAGITERKPKKVK